jgi:hypothetical protein
VEAARQGGGQGLRGRQPIEAHKTLGKPALFSDDVGYTALLLQGRYPQKHMKNGLGRELCLFERKSGTAHVKQADAFGR